VRKVVGENGSELKNFAVRGGGMGMGGRRRGGEGSGTQRIKKREAMAGWGMMGEL